MLAATFAVLAGGCVIGSSIVVWVVTSRAAVDFLNESENAHCKGLTQLLFTMRATNIALGAGALGGALATIILWRCSGMWWLCSACAESPGGTCLRILFILWAVVTLAECILLTVWHSCDGWSPAKRERDGLVGACILSGSAVLFWLAYHVAKQRQAKRQENSSSSATEKPLVEDPKEDNTVEATVMVERSPLKHGL